MKRSATGRRRFSALRRWLLVAAVMLALLISLEVTALALPQLWVPHRTDHGDLTLFSDRAITPEQETALREIVARLGLVEVRDPSAHLRVFLISDPKLYSRFARLALVPPVVPGFNLSLLDNSFVSVAGLEERRRRNAGGFPYSAAEGDLVHCVMHELMHDYMVGEIGFFRSLRLPVWKKEGYAEYGSRLALVRSDDALPLSRRVRLLLEQPMSERAREYSSWGLVVEFLGEVEGYSHAEIMAEDLTLEPAYEEMLEWYRALESPS